MKILVTGKCKDCGKKLIKRTAIWCKPHGYQHRKRPSGLKYNIVAQNKGWFRFQGGGLDDHGYRKLHIGRQKYKREHRLTMERHLRRNLSQHEVVHHINGDKLDNRVENLQLMSKKQHDRWHQGKKRIGLIV